MMEVTSNAKVGIILQYDLQEVYYINTLYTLNIHSVVCQLYLNNEN